MTLLINCSLRSPSNSLSILEYLGEQIDDSVIVNITKKNQVDNYITTADKIVFSFPLYVDSPCGSLLELLEDYNNYYLAGKTIYAISNCGFLESHHNQIALDIIENWCLENNIKYGGGLLIGSGEIIGKYNKSFVNKLLSYSSLKKIDIAASKINYGSYFKNIHMQIPCPKRVYIGCANKNWRRQIY